MTKFIHIRARDKSVLGLFTKQSHHGGSTVAYDLVLNADGSPEKIVYAVSFCADADRYDKAKGRVIAEGRLLCKRGNRVHVIAYQPDIPIAEQVLKDAQDCYDYAGIKGLL